MWHVLVYLIICRNEEISVENKWMINKINREISAQTDMQIESDYYRCNW